MRLSGGKKKKVVPPYVLPDFPTDTKSVPDFMEDSPELMQELFEYDQLWGKYDQALADIDDDDAENTKEVLKKYYLPIKNVFLVLQSECEDLKNIEIQQFVDFCVTAGIVDEKFGPEELMKTYEDANTDTDTRLNRCEFIGSLIRVALIKYKDKDSTVAEDLETLLTHEILNRVPMAQGIYFRNKYVTKEIVDMLAYYEEDLMTIYENCSTMEQAKTTFKKMGYKISKLPVYYVESLMSKNFYTETPELEYQEFLMFLLRLSKEFKFDLLKTMPKIIKAQQKKSGGGLFGFK